MDLMAMRGGILDWRRAAAIVAGFDGAERAHARRSATATPRRRVPRRAPAGQRGLPPVAADASRRRGDRRALRAPRLAALVPRRGRRRGSARATSPTCSRRRTIVRYALSFDGLATKVNHHQTVSEYFTPPNELRRNGFDRLIRLAVGLEDADDLIAALNWTLHHGADISADEVKAWQQARIKAWVCCQPASSGS